MYSRSIPLPCAKAADASAIVANAAVVAILHHIPVEVTGDSVAKVKNGAATARGSHVWDEAALLGENAVRRRCVHVRDDVAPLDFRRRR
jgi:hypothetical protein